MALSSGRAVRIEPTNGNSASDGSPVSRFPVEDFKRAMEEADSEALFRVCTEDFVFAPLGTDRAMFQGRERVSYLLKALMGACHTFNYTGESYVSHDTIALPLRATYAGGKREITAVDVLRINEEGKATEMRVFGRTYMQVTLLAGQTGMNLLRQAGFLWWLPFRIGLYPLEWTWRFAERIGIGWTGMAMNWALKRAGRSNKRRYA
jgi:hypothetical protein